MPIQPKTDKKDQFFKTINDVACSFAFNPLNPLAIDAEPYDTVKTPAIIYQQAQGFLSEIKANLPIYKSLGADVWYLSGLRTEVDDILSDGLQADVDPYGNAFDFVGSVQMIKREILLEIDKLSTQLQEKQPDIKKPEQKRKAMIGETKLQAKHYVMTYLLDCLASGEKIPWGEKTKLEEIGEKRNAGGSGNTFRKVLGQLADTNLGKGIVNDAEMNRVFGLDWAEIARAISKDPERLKSYLAGQAKIRNLRLRGLGRS